MVGVCMWEECVWEGPVYTGEAHMWDVWEESVCVWEESLYGRSLYVGGVCVYRRSPYVGCMGGVCVLEGPIHRRSLWGGAHMWEESVCEGPV